MLRSISILLATGSLLLAQDQPGDEKAAPEKPVIRDLGGGKFEVGAVQFHRKTREISFETEVNMKDGPLEYAIVHRNGKIHEAILITKARPFHLNIALKVLGYKESKELFPILDEEYRPTGKFPKVSEAVKNAARAEILLSWKDKEGKAHKASLNDWVTHTVTKKPLPALPWVYGGSYIHNKSFQAEASGDIVALFTNNASLFNWPGKDSNLDDVWLPTTKRIPDVGTVVTVTIKPFVSKAGAAVGKTMPELLADGSLQPEVLLGWRSLDGYSTDIPRGVLEDAQEFLGGGRPENPGLGLSENLPTPLDFDLSPKVPTVPEAPKTLPLPEPKKNTGKDQI